MSKPREPKSAEVLDLRRRAGKWLKARREGMGLSQSQLAGVLGSDHYTFISQIEIGRSRVPTERYRDWARALDMDDRLFVREMLRFYDPILYEVIFEGTPERVAVAGNGVHAP